AIQVYNFNEKLPQISVHLQLKKSYVIISPLERNLRFSKADLSVASYSTAIDVISDSPDISKPPKIYHILTLDDTENEDDGIFVNDTDILLEIAVDEEINPSVLPMETLQINNFVIKNPQDSVEDPLNFSYARNSISIYNDYLIHRNRKDHYHYVVSFNFALQVAIINHYEFAHIGQNKLYALLDWIIWHPKLRMICKDISIACHHCQLGKVSNIYHAPPTLKINARFPFELVAVDLLQLPKSSKGNSYVFILIDHYKTKRSPAEIIFTEAHDTRPNLPWTQFNEYWDEGNTNYKSFPLAKKWL
ncbi:hypothetical protein Avbf_15444, partial [Armadillidium vulgare]